MGDSDDEFDRRRGRDKFRGERNEFQRRDDRRGGGGWEDNKRSDWGNRERNFDQRPRRFSPPSGRMNDSPPQKRMRRDWDGDGNNAEHAGGGWGGAGADGQTPGGFSGQQKPGETDYPTQPPMKAFKAFLTEQDDNISDEDAVKNYNEYKLDFKKQQINEFFLAHKEEEWFKAKYHPEECAKKREVCETALRARCDAFTKLLQMSRVNAVSIDTERNEDLVKLLDAAVILMEGGTDFDLEVLEAKHSQAIETQRSRTISEPAVLEKPEVPVTVTFNKEEDGGKEEGEEGETQEEGAVTEDGETKENGEMEEGEEEGEEKSDEKPAKSEEAAPAGQKEEVAEAEKKSAEDIGEIKEEEKKEEEVEKPKKGKKRRRESNDSWSGSDSDGSFTSSESEAGDKAEKTPPAPGMDSSTKEAQKEGEGEKEMDTQDCGPQPKALHKTQSIFLRNLDPSITKQEVESMCRQYPGFLRVGLQDPLPERRFFRRGWVTFDRTVNIKDICWNLNNIRLRDCDMGAIVNRELKQRIRPINGVTCHKPVCKADIKHAAKIVQKLDNKTGLWKEDSGEKKDREKSQPSYGLISRNPVLKNITDYLVDEGSYEEEAYLGALADGDAVTPATEQPLERDEENIRVLDRMILYLRIVHSFDYFTAVEYPNEDEMPHRCGIMHARAPPPKAICENEVNEYNSVFEVKVKNYMNLKSKLNKDEAVRLGKKNEDAEIEKFLQANTQELAKDKWLCPLSGKKFKGPEFIRKHILNKHEDKVDEVKVETEYFNNYLLDPKRPQLPEHPSQKTRPSAPPSAPSGPGGPNEGGYQGGSYQGGGYQGGGYQGGGYQGSFYRGGFQGNRGRGNWRGGGHWRGGGYRRGGGGGYNDYQSPGGGGFGSSRGDGLPRRESARDRLQMPLRRDRSRGDPRGIIEYRDLDAPDDPEIF